MGKSLLSFCSRAMVMVAMLCLPLLSYAEQLTVNDGTATNGRIPTYPYYTDTYKNHSQFIIPASELTSLASGSSISAIKFYTSGTWSKSPATPYELRVMNVAAGTICTSAFADVTSADLVYSGTIDVVGGDFEVTFTNEFEYSGGDILVDFRNTSSTGYWGSSSTTFYGTALTSGGCYATTLTGTATVVSFSPKMTLTYLLPSSCPKPASIAASNVTATTADLAWTAGGSEASWVLVLSEGANETSSVETGLSKSLTGLKSATDYTASIYAICAVGDTSYARTVSFSTECGTIANLPWTENFNGCSSGSGNLPRCWSYTSSSDSYPYVYDYQGYDGKCLYFYGGGTGTYARTVVLPVIDASVDMTNTRIKFFAKSYENTSYYNYGNLIVGVMSDPSAATSFVGLDTLPQYNSYVEYEIALTNAPSTHRYVAIRYAGGEYNYGYAYVDNIEISEIPSCRPARNLHFASATKNSATFAWTPANGETEWQVQYKKAADAAYVTETLTTPSLTISSLDASSIYTYNFILHSSCGGSLSPDSVKTTVKFCTECDVVVPTNDTITFNFDSYSTGALSNIPCWSEFINKGATFKSAATWNVSTTYKNSGANSLYLYLNYGSDTISSVFATPQVDLPEGYELSFYARRGNASYSIDSVIVYRNTTASLVGATKLGVTGQLSATEFERYRFNVGGRDQMYILFEVFGKSYGSIYVDDIVLQPAPSCLPVSNVAISAVTGTTVTFTWTPGGSETAWDFHAEDEAGTIYEEAIGLTSPTYTIEGLDPQTRYTATVNVYADCSGTLATEAAGGNYSFMTLCESTTLPFSENFNDLAASSIPDCWNNEEGTTTDASYKFCMSTAGYSSTNCVGFNSYNNPNGNTNFLKTPVIDAAEAVRFSFKWCNPTGGDLSVYYTIDGGDMVLLKSGMKSTSTWTTETFDIPGSEGHLVQFIFKGTSNYGYTRDLVRVDDVEVIAQPSCVAVRNLKASNITTTSARIGWEAGKNETSWSVVVRQNTDTLINTTMTTPYFDIDTLHAAHVYSYKVTVKAICDGVVAEEFLPEQNVNFATECEVYQLSATNPWSDGFESYSSYSDLVDVSVCYSETSNGDAWAIGTTYPNSGSKGIYRYYSTFVNTGILALPLMNIPAANEYEFKFALKRSTLYNDSVAIYLSDNTEIPAGAPLWVSKVKYSEDVVESAAGWYEYNVTLPAAGDKHVLVVVYGKTSSQSIYMDDFCVRKIPSCVGATNLHVIDSVATASSVTLAWSGNASQYVLSYASADSAYYNTVTVSDTAYVISGLPSSKDFKFNAYVVSKCSETDFAVDTVFASNLSASTLCEAISSLPWVEGFENAATGSGKVPACFSSFTRTYSSTQYPYVLSTTTSYEGSKCLYFYNYYTSSSDKQMIVTPEFSSSIDLTNSRVMFYYKNYSTSTTSGQFIVGTMADPLDYATFHPLDTLERVTTYTKYELALTAAPTTDHYVAIQLIAGSSYSDYSHYIDNLSVTEIPSCFPGTNLHIIDSLATTSSVSFGWTPNEATNLNAHIVIKNGTTILADSIIADSVFTLAGLSSSWGATLNVTVNTICGGAESTDALTANLSVRTLCDPIATLPWSENFDNNAYMGCWDLPTGVSAVSTTYTQSGSYALKFATTSDVVVKLPEFAHPVAGLELDFSWRCEGTSNTTMGYLEAGYVLGSNFVALHTDATHKYAYESVQLAFPDDVPAGARIAFRYYGATSTSWYLFVDDVTVKLAPACHKPASVTATAGTDNVVLAWSGNSDAYDVLVKNGTDTVANTQVSSASLTITGLSAATVYNYTVKIQGLCGTDSSAVLTSAVSFVTECLPVATLPWSEGFESATEDEMPICWTKVTSPSCLYPYVYESGTNSHGAGTKYLYAYAGTSYYGDEYIVLPEFAADVKTAVLKFYYKQGYATSYYMVPQVGVMASATDTANFVPVATLTASTSYTLQEIDLGSAPAGYHFIAIKLPASVTSSTYYYFDDFEVVAAPTCRKPGVISLASTSDTEATFAWAPSGDETQWLVQRTVGGVKEDSVLVSAPNYSWGNLTAYTKYTCTLSVQAYCDAENQSEARTATFSFRTALAAADIETLNASNATYSANFADTTEQAKWKAIEGNGTNDFVFSKDPAAYLNSAQSALYISNNDSTYQYATGSYSGALIYRQFDLPAVDSLLIEFDWMAKGESTYDYGRAFFAPANLEMKVSSGSLYIGGTSAITSTSCPAGAVDLGGGEMSGVTAAEHESVKIANVAAGRYNIIFGWKNDSSGGAQSPLSICNLTVSILDEQGPATGVENVIYGESGEKAVKFIRNGHVYIIFQGVTYDATGRMVENVK